MIPKLDNFFIKVILPKALCGTESSAAADEQNGIHCLCRRGESGMMIECDSMQCEIGWYHYSCVNLPPDFEPADDERMVLS